MLFKRLKDSHPAFVAMGEVFQKMDDVGIQIEIGAYGQPQIIFNGQSYNLLDVEDSPHEILYNNHPISLLPPEMDFKLIYKVEEENLD